MALAVGSAPPPRFGLLVADTSRSRQRAQTVTQLYVIDERDAESLRQLREQLKDRRADLGLRVYEVAKRCGRHPEFVSMLERGISASPKLSSLQLWAGGVDARIEFELPGFWDVEHDDPQMLWLDGMREPWGKDSHMRLWLVAALRAWRVVNGVDIGVVAQAIGMHRNGAYRWEWESVDPLFGRVAATARVLGVPLQMRLVWREDWVEPGGLNV